jgi:AcrR family transcriptional regulator
MSPRGQEQNEQMRTEAIRRISEAALNVFAEYGYHGATMKQINHASGLSHGLIYHYFPSKADLFYHLVDFALDSSLTTLRTVLDGPEPAWQKIENLSAVLVHGALAEESSLYFLIVLHALTQGRTIPGVPERISDGFDGYYATLVPVIEQAQRDAQVAEGDPLALAAAYFSFVQGLSTLRFHRKGAEQRITPTILSNVLRREER